MIKRLTCLLFWGNNAGCDTCSWKTTSNFRFQRKKIKYTIIVYTKKSYKRRTIYLLCYYLYSNKNVQKNSYLVIYKKTPVWLVNLQNSQHLRAPFANDRAQSLDLRKKCESSQEKMSLEQVELSFADQQENSYTPHPWYTLLCPSFTGFRTGSTPRPVLSLRNCSSATMVSHWYFPCTLSSKEPPLSHHSILSNNVKLCVR